MCSPTLSSITDSPEGNNQSVHVQITLECTHSYGIFYRSAQLLVHITRTRKFSLKVQTFEHFIDTGSGASFSIGPVGLKPYQY